MSCLAYASGFDEMCQTPPGAVYLLIRELEVRVLRGAHFEAAPPQSVAVSVFLAVSTLVQVQNPAALPRQSLHPV